MKITGQFFAPELTESGPSVGAAGQPPSRIGPRTGDVEPDLDLGVAQDEAILEVRSFELNILMKEAEMYNESSGTFFSQNGT